MGDYLFSYGTLLPGRTPNEIAAAVEKLRPVGDGFVRAVLYDLGDYPGAVLDPSSQQIVAGTVFQLPEDEDVLRNSTSTKDSIPTRQARASSSVRDAP